jgi:hypothetical protein
MGQIKPVQRHDEQITEEQFKRLSAGEKLQAAKDGRLVDLMDARSAELDGLHFTSTAAAERYRHSKNTNEGNAS